MESVPRNAVRRAPNLKIVKLGTAAMNGKSSKFASTVLAALLYTQALLCVGAFTMVVLKDRVQADPVVVASVASEDAQLR